MTCNVAVVGTRTSGYNETSVAAFPCRNRLIIFISTKCFFPQEIPVMIQPDDPIVVVEDRTMMACDITIIGGGRRCKYVSAVTIGVYIKSPFSGAPPKCLFPHNISRRIKLHNPAIVAAMVERYISIR